MMSKIFFEVAISMDGFIVGLNGDPKNPLGEIRKITLSPKVGKIIPNPNDHLINNNN